jgi:hypothetical protein
VQKRLDKIKLLRCIYEMSIYAGISISILQARLIEAQDAYHALNTGQQAVSLSAGDKRLAFTAAEVDKLSRYIRELQGAIAVLQGGTDPRARPSIATWTR